MEANLPSGNMIPGGTSYGSLDLQSPLRVHHHQQSQLTLHQHNHSHPSQGPMVHPLIHESFPLTIGTMQDCDPSISLADYAKGERGKNSASDEDEDGDGHNDSGRGKKTSLWQRVKWTDKMVRILITAVSYIGEEAANEYGGGSRRKYANLQKKGKWKSVSKVMAERGHFVSPQQCEDKFNDLNKRYKRLNEILGRGTSCEVVENPALLDVMDISEKSKEEVRKILSSKHLYYEEMCSYHNGNRLHLPPDPELQHSLRLALRSRDDRHPHDDLDDDDQDAEMDDHDEFEELQALHGDRRGLLAKKLKQGQGHEDFNFGNSKVSLDCNKTSNFQSQNAHADVNQANLLEKQWMKQRSLQLEEQKLQILANMLELEKERYKWERFCRKRDRELEMMRMENERMKLENDHMAIELKRKEMGRDNN
ncbi:hypothetical protein LguiA_004273 [Lonicera macranthoides]